MGSGKVKRGLGKGRRKKERSESVVARAGEAGKGVGETIVDACLRKPREQRGALDGGLG